MRRARCMVSESRRHHGWRLAGPWQVGGNRVAADGGRSRGEALHRSHGVLEKGGAEARNAETTLGQSPAGASKSSLSRTCVSFPSEEAGGGAQSVPADIGSCLGKGTGRPHRLAYGAQAALPPPEQSTSRSPSEIPVGSGVGLCLDCPIPDHKHLPSCSAPWRPPLGRCPLVWPVLQVLQKARQADVKVPAQNAASPAAQPNLNGRPRSIPLHPSIHTPAP